MSDCQFCEEFLGACGVALQNAQSYQAAVQEYKKNQLLLNLAKSLFQEQTSLDRLITSIIVQAKEMLQCERCTIFLLDLKMYDQVRPKVTVLSLFGHHSNQVFTCLFFKQPTEASAMFVKFNFNSTTAA